jgi:Carboxypeptidase regulatory-like domain
MKRISITFLVGLLGSTVTCGSVWAQATAQISGTVRDQSGAVLPGVEVTATQTDTGISRMTVTNETGSYILPNLAVGPYRIEASLTGFRTFVQTGIVLQVNSNPAINPVLNVGQVTEQVEVQANAALVETRSTAVGEVIETQRILELPLPARNVTNLITLAAGSSQGGAGSVPGGFVRGTSAATNYVSVGGGLYFGVMYALDGAMHNDAYDNSQIPFPFPDALQEFKVDASGMGAAGGSRGSGGQISGVTKSGTNELHGSAFEFVRNYAFNARNPFAKTRDDLKRNQFGGTLGGPVLKNKLFFFGGYQGTLTRTAGGGNIAFVPTPAMMAGDWTTFASPACNVGKQINLGAPFHDNRIDPSSYSKPAVKVAAMLPAAQDDCGKVVYDIPLKPNEYQIVNKVDYQQSARHSLFERYIVTRYRTPHPYDITHDLLALNTTDGGNEDLAHGFAVGSTYLVSPNTINAVRLGMTRVIVGRPGIHFFGPSDIGVDAYTYSPGNMVLQINGGFMFNTRGVYAHNVSNAYNINDDVNVVRGNHQITFGGNVSEYKVYQRCLVSGQGVYSFNGSATSLGMADFLTGRLTSLMQVSAVLWSSRQTYVAAYLQDVWKMSSRVTLNAGVRWEPFLPLAVGYGQGAHLNEGGSFQFSQDRFSKGIRSTIYPNAPVGLYFPGDPGFPKHGSTNAKLHYFAPRLGLAWDVRGDGRTSVRASYGIAFDYSGAQTYGGSSSAPPWGFNTTTNSGDFANPWANYPGGNPFPYVRLSRFPNFSDYYFVPNFNASSPQIHTWNLSIQRQIPGNFLVSASYLGNQAIHTWVGGYMNRAIYFPGTAVNGICTAQGYVLHTTGTCSTTGNTNQRRILALQNPTDGQLYGNLFTREDVGTQHYHGMLLSIQRRASNGGTVAANYTWSHCISIDPTANDTGRGGPGYLDPNNRRFDYGNCGNHGADRRQIFNLTGVVPSPQFQGLLLRKLASGWQLGGILRASTGDFMSVVTGVDRALDGQAGAAASPTGAANGQRPNQILVNPYGDRSSTSHYLNPLAFEQPAFGTFGNMRPFSIEGPGYWQLDMALARIFQVRESRRLEFRAEAFNMTNRFIPMDPNLTLSSNTFGQITSSGNARIMQFALRYAF